MSAQKKTKPYLPRYGRNLSDAANADHDTAPKNSPSAFCALPPEAFLRLPEVISLVSLKRTTIYDLIQRGKFPSPTKLTLHASGWRVSDIRKWLSDPTSWRPARSLRHEA